MKERITIGIDIGTYQVKVVVTKTNPNGNSLPQIIGTGLSESRGLRNGYIINESDATRSIQAAIAQAEKSSNTPIKHAYLAIGSVGLDEIFASGEIITSRADGEVTESDIQNAIQDAEDKIQEHIPNRRILHDIPLSFTLDGERVLGRPVGLKGTKLEVDVLFVTAIEQHITDFIKVVNEAGVSVDDVMASPIAASLVTLSKAQKRAGCLIANLGAETLSITVYENSLPLSLKVFPVGSNDITNDIALGLRISLEEAEKVKRVGGGSRYSKRKLDEIVNSRLSDIFELIDTHLKQIKRDGLLPAGIILIGGGSNLSSIDEVAKQALRLPARAINLDPSINGKVKDSIWAVAYGLCILGQDDQTEYTGIGIAKHAGNSIMKWLSQFLP